MTLAPENITDLSCAQIDALVLSLGEPLYRAAQIRKWVYQGLAGSFDEMTNLPIDLRNKLAAKTGVRNLELVRQVTGGDRTVKALLKCSDGNTVETALMYYAGEDKKERWTVCVSTQAGCGMGCPFCATGQQGLDRNLTAGEIVSQVLHFASMLRDKPAPDAADVNAGHSRVSNVVFMGMGEPLANYDNLWRAVETLNSPDCFKLGARNMTISTSGLVPQIKRLAREKLQVGLAVSLHAADNDLRNKLVPVNRKYPLEQLIPACREYTQLTGRRLSFEYTLFNGINASTAHARALAALIHGLNAHVNLIPANITPNAAYGPPPARVVLAFENELSKAHVNVTLREPRGRDIDAGCGQMRGRHRKETGE
jgi:23S rRNA (adenine2503-C2)-methyltransferase